jgi:hypothetical protein
LTTLANTPALPAARYWSALIRPNIRISEAIMPVQPGLVAGSNVGFVISVEILVEQKIVLPLRIRLELLIAAENRPASILIAEEDPGYAESLIALLPGKTS